MLSSLAWVLMTGLLAAWIFRQLKLPALLGMLLTGIVLGPRLLNLLDNSLLAAAGDLRQLALIVILTRVGLSLDMAELKQVGRPAFLLCWVPATFELAGVMVLAVGLLGTSWLEGAIMGSVLAAVSPAVIVPRMLGFMERGYGRRKGIPQLLMAGASMDDVYVIVCFTSLTAVAAGAGIGWRNLVHVPLAIAGGAMFGALAGWGLTCWFSRFSMRDPVRVLILLSISFWFVALEKRDWVPFSGLLGVMCCGLMILHRSDELARRLAAQFAKLWVGAEVVLFVLVGAAVDVRYALAAGGTMLAVVVLALALRMAGVYVSLLGSGLTPGERFFCMLACTPKATVQAAIGAVPLGMGLPCGRSVLTLAVISILLTAPLGALAIDLTGDRLLAADR